MSWLEGQFDRIYQVAQEGQELSSPVVNNAQTLVSEAIRYLQYQYKDNPEFVGQFTSDFLVRLNLIFMRSSVDHRNLEGVRKMAESLQAHGLLSALTMESGNTYKMFARMNELLEDKRLAQEKLVQKLAEETNPRERENITRDIEQLHIAPEMMSGLQADLIKEQLEVAKLGVGDYGERYESLIKEGRLSEAQASAAIENDITRAVRVAYDVFVVCQRQAVIVARGHALPRADAYMSDPGALFNVLNQEDLLTMKFHIYNVTSVKFLNALKMDMARSELKEKARGMSEEELLDYGTRRFRDLFAVPDFFSSGWRVNGVLRKINERLEKEGLSDRRDDFGLFLKLKGSREFKPGEELIAGQYDRRAIWEKIAEIRPEEIVRLYRERAINNRELTTPLNEFFAGSAFDGFRVMDSEGHIDSFRTYDKFKKEFGTIVQLLRQSGYKEFRALRIGTQGFSEAERTLIAKYFKGDATKADQLQRMFAKITSIAQQESIIHALMKHNKFEDIYTRTLLVDDAFLDILEKSSAENKGIMPVSRYWSSEVGGDALVRNYGDMDHATKAGSALLNFVYKESPKEKLDNAMTFAEETSQYNGQEARARCMRYTFGSFLGVSKQDFIWDALGVGKLPFRRAMSEIERIYGPQAMPMSRDDLRAQLDNIRTYLVGMVDYKQAPEEVAKQTKEADKYYRELAQMLEVTAKDMTKRRAVSLLFFLIFAALIEGYAVLDINSLAGKK